MHATTAASLQGAQKNCSMYEQHCSLLDDAARYSPDSKPTVCTRDLISILYKNNYARVLILRMKNKTKTKTKENQEKG